MVEFQPGVCWWCGSPADSREHIYKRTDLIREFGPPPYSADDPPVRRREGAEDEMRGPNSQLARYQANLCQPCNNARSQPFDFAYDRFAAHLRDTEDQIFESRSVDLAVIYGPDWFAASRDLIRHFVKRLLCRLADHSLQRPVSAPRELIDFLNGAGFPDCLQLDAALDESIVRNLRVIAEAEAEGRPHDHDEPILTGGFLGRAGLHGWLDVKTNRMSPPIESGDFYRWFALYWQVAPDVPPLDPFATQVIALSTADPIFP